MKKNESNELDSMTIILHIGNAKSEAYEALKAVKEGDIETFDQKYKLAKKMSFVLGIVHTLKCYASFHQKNV